MTLEASTSGLAFAKTKTESNDRLRDELHSNLITKPFHKASLLQKKKEALWAPRFERMQLFDSDFELITTKHLR